jgi:5-methyltetrahydrofolate--homocysteine methyltransferase
MRYRPSLQSSATAMRKQPSRAERALWTLLRNRRFEGFKFRRQHQIDCYIADFACVSAKLVIEVDGPSHDLPDQIAHDRMRTLRLSELGWRILRLTNGEVPLREGEGME